MIICRNVYSDMKGRYVHMTHGSMSKIKVPLRGQRSKLYRLYRVWVITSQIIVVFYNTVYNCLFWHVIIVIGRYVNKTHDPMSKVNFLLRGQRSKFGNLYCVIWPLSITLTWSEWKFLQGTMNKQHYLTYLVMDWTRYKINKFWPLTSWVWLWPFK